jgi:response regulator RpfG family c-di-GMP phosphodiesterase
VKPRVLLVDDDEHLLRSLDRVLRSRFEITTAPSGTEGIAALSAAGEPFAVIVSDYQMPFMNGAQFLSRARKLAPDTTRVLLTGEADIGGGAAGINGGGIVRLLLKPVATDELVGALDEAVTQHRLVLSERELLDHTLAGSIKAMSEVLSLTSPAAFARATRMRALSALLFEALEQEQPWHVSVAVTLSQIGAVTLPPSVLEHMNVNVHLSDEEAAMVAKLPALAEQVLSEIPRLEEVRAAIRLQDTPDGPLGARVLRLVRDYDALEVTGMPAGEALSRLESRVGAYDVTLLTALAKGLAERGDRTVIQIPLAKLEVGMTLADDVFTASGVKLVPVGHAVTPSLLQRIVNFSEVAPGIVEPICVFSPRRVKRPSWPGDSRPAPAPPARVP